MMVSVAFIFSRAGESSAGPYTISHLPAPAQPLECASTADDRPRARLGLALPLFGDIRREAHPHRAVRASDLPVDQYGSILGSRLAWESRIVPPARRATFARPRERSRPCHNAFSP